MCIVNNVGLSIEHADYFNNVPEDVRIYNSSDNVIILFRVFLFVTQRHRNVVEVNCQTMVQMTHLVLPKMVERYEHAYQPRTEVSTFNHTIASYPCLYII